MHFPDAKWTTWLALQLTWKWISFPIDITTSLIPQDQVTPFFHTRGANNNLWKIIIYNDNNFPSNHWVNIPEKRAWLTKISFNVWRIEMIIDKWPYPLILTTETDLPHSEKFKMNENSCHNHSDWQYIVASTAKGFITWYHPNVNKPFCS